MRNSKPDQLLKIANAPGISINSFMDFDIETVSDVLSLLFKLDVFIKKLCTYMKALEIRENMIHAKDAYSEEYADILQHISENIELNRKHPLQK